MSFVEYKQTLLLDMSEIPGSLEICSGLVNTVQLSQVVVPICV